MGRKIKRVFNNKYISSFIIPNEICKGFSIHSLQGIIIWEKILNTLIGSFEKEFSKVSIVKNLPVTCDIKLLKSFYGDKFYRISDRIPFYVDYNHKKKQIITDELPFLSRYVAEKKCIFATYSVVRPRSFAVKTFLREEFIRYFQIIVSFKDDEKKLILDKISKALTMFFEKLNINVVLVDRASDSYYEKKSCYHAVWLNGHIESILQCGLLKNKSTKNDKFLIDIGGAQRLLATFLFANSDSSGLYLPKFFRDFDVMLVSKKHSNFLDQIIKCCNESDIRVLKNDKLGIVPINKIKFIAKQNSLNAILIQRIVENKEFITIYTRDNAKTDIYTIKDLQVWINRTYYDIENESQAMQKEIIDSHIHKNKLYPTESYKSYNIISEGLFLK